MAKYKVIDDSEYLVDEKELGKFYNEIHEMAKRRFGVNFDGDPRVQVSVLDRTRYEGMQYMEVPYPYKARTENEKEFVLERAMFNLEVAMDRASEEIRQSRFRRHARLKALDSGK